MFKVISAALISLSLLSAPTLAKKCAPGTDYEPVVASVKQQMKDKKGSFIEYDEATSEAIVTKLSGGRAPVADHKYIFTAAIVGDVAYWAVFIDGCFLTSEAVPLEQYNAFVKKAIEEGNV